MCRLLKQVNAAAASATSPDQGLTVLRRFAPQLGAAARSAVPAARADLTTLETATTKAVSTSDLSALATDPVVAAGARLLTLCGQSAPPSAATAGGPSKS